MIRSAPILKDIRGQWAVVRRFAMKTGLQYMIPGGSHVSESFPEEFYNLPLVLAYGVLQQALETLADEGVVVVPVRRKQRPRAKTKKRGKRPSLEDLIRASRT